LPHVWALLCRGGIDCEVTYGAPIRFERISDRKAVARQTEAAVRRLVGRSLAGRLSEDGDAPFPEPQLVPELEAA
jgi:hypothetical protein